MSDVWPSHMTHGHVTEDVEGGSGEYCGICCGSGQWSFVDADGFEDLTVVFLTFLAQHLYIIHGVPVAGGGCVLCDSKAHMLAISVNATKATLFPQSSFNFFHPWS